MIPFSNVFTVGTGSNKSVAFAIRRKSNLNQNTTDFIFNSMTMVELSIG